MDLVLENYKEWCSKIFDKESINKAKTLKLNDPTEFQDSFYKNLEFGTGGMRGIMGVGPNRVNKYTFGKTSQGICNFLNKENKGKRSSIVIGRDCRNNGYHLQKVVSNIFSNNGIKVFFFESEKPTPLISFAVQHLKCDCGIVLTASHNPPEYNGFKVYWSDGAQIVPPTDKKLILEIEKLKYSDIKFKGSKNLINFLDDEVESTYIKKSLEFSKSLFNKPKEKKLNIVFTSLHGTSYELVPKLLKSSGFNNIKFVKNQMHPDGNFSNVQSANPEDPRSLYEAVKIAKKHKYDIAIGTDPDSDRFGIAVRNLKDEYVHINGNQVMSLMTEYILSNLKYKKNSFIASTVVSTPMMQQIAKLNNIELKLTLTGFKWIGKLIKDFKKLKFICGGEESFGFLVGDFVRDKDALSSILILCEICNELKHEKSSFYDKLINCFIKYGFYKERLITKTESGVKGTNKIKNIISSMRINPPKLLGNSKVRIIHDYLKSITYNVYDNSTKKISLPRSNLIILESEDGSRVGIRPSGTEPKIKYYFSVNSKLTSKENFETTNMILDKKINLLIKQLT